MSRDGGRYAIYFAPEPASPLALFGAEWLGYDAVTGANPAQPRLAAITAARLRAITAEPRRYGFHATLKAPFALAAGSNEDRLGDAVAGLAKRFSPFAVSPLGLRCLYGFWALMLSGPCPMMDRLAAVCVSELDGFRAPPGDDELARRRRGGLSPRQDALLECWGYPYVMEEFRFHMTLTARLDPEESEAVRRGLSPIVEPVCRMALPIDAISLFRQDRRDSSFRLLSRYPLAGAASV